MQKIKVLMQKRLDDSRPREQDQRTNTGIYRALFQNSRQVFTPAFGVNVLGEVMPVGPGAYDGTARGDKRTHA